MNIKRLLTTTAIVIAITAPAYAADSGDRSMRNDVSSVSKEDVKEAWDNTKNTVEDAAEDMAEAVQEAYEDIKVAIEEEKEEQTEQATADDNHLYISEEQTASELIGRNVFNEDGYVIASIDDIILNKEGKAELIVLRDEGALNIGGTLVAIDYSRLTERHKGADMVLPLTERRLKTSQPFTYEEEANNNEQTLEPDQLRLSELIGADITTPEEDSPVASVENVSLKNGQADQLILSYNGFLGFGEDKAAMSFGDISLNRDNYSNDLEFEMSEAQATAFDKFNKKNGR